VLARPLPLALSRPRQVRVWSLWAAGWLLVVALASPAEAEVELHVRGRSYISLQESSSNDEIEIRGRLSDDFGRPLEGATIHWEEIDRRTAAARPLSGTSPCETRTSASPDSSQSAPQTDVRGEFCLRVAATVARSGGSWRIRFDGIRDYDPAVVDLDPINLRGSLSIDWSETPREIPVDHDSVRLRWRLVGPPSNADVAPQTVSIHAKFVGDQQPAARSVELGQVRAPINAPTTTFVDPRKLGGPGPGRLVLGFAGDAKWLPMHVSVPAIRTAMVRVEPARPLPTLTPGKRCLLEFRATSKVGQVVQGAVESIVDAGQPRLWPLNDGRTVVPLDVPKNSARDLTLRIRFAPGSPGWLAGPPITLHLPMQQTSPWRYAAWYLAGLAVLGWLVWTRRGYAAPKKRRGPPRRSELIPIAKLEWQATLDGTSGLDAWGTVIDAHDGVPIGSAQLRVTEVGFAAERVLARTISDTNGKFSFPEGSLQSLPRPWLVAEARHHSTFRAQIPGPGRLVVHMVNRRRTLLARLVDWIGKGTHSRFRSAEPTPEEIAHHADQIGDSKVAEWAREVGLAAFGPRQPDSDDEARLEPPNGPAAIRGATRRPGTPHRS